MKIRFEQLNPCPCLTYLVGCPEAKEVILVDPLIDHVDGYLKKLAAEGLTLTHVVDTHTHADHISGAALLMDRTGAEYVMYEDARPNCPTVRVADGYECKTGGLSFKIVHTPGHTMDSICLVFDDRIFTGDTLFLDDGGAGRDDLPGGDPALHYDSLERLKGLPDNLMVYPAHEYRGRTPSTLGEQKARNPHLAGRTKEEFIDYLEDLKLGPAEWMKGVLKANIECTRDSGAAFIPTDIPACEVKGTMTEGMAMHRVEEITPEEVSERLTSGAPPLLLDVREAPELTGEFGSLSGITHIPVGELEGRLSELDGKEDAEIVVICRSGARADTAARVLQNGGFARVSIMKGGMGGWRKAELTLKKEE